MFSSSPLKGIQNMRFFTCVFFAESHFENAIKSPIYSNLKLAPYMKGLVSSFKKIVKLDFWLILGDFLIFTICPTKGFSNISKKNFLIQHYQSSVCVFGNFEPVRYQKVRLCAHGECKQS
jgi:hypothetical protein